MIEFLNLLHLKCALRGDEQILTDELSIIQRAKARREPIPSVLLRGMELRERQLIREVNHLKRLQLTTPDHLVVAYVSGGTA